LASGHDHTCVRHAVYPSAAAAEFQHRNFVRYFRRCASIQGGAVVFCQLMHEDELLLVQCEPESIVISSLCRCCDPITILIGVYHARRDRRYGAEKAGDAQDNGRFLGCDVRIETNRRHDRAPNESVVLRRRLSHASLNMKSPIRAVRFFPGIGPQPSRLAQLTG
jgi:hypothetical protein